jgi:hypothetical protein
LILFPHAIKEISLSAASLAVFYLPHRLIDFSTTLSSYNGVFLLFPIFCHYLCQALTNRKAVTYAQGKEKYK